MKDELDQKLPEDTFAAQISANEQMGRERRNRISSDVCIFTTSEYRCALVRAFYSGMKHGRFVGTREIAARLSKEEDMRQKYQQRAYDLANENERPRHEMRVLKERSEMQT